MDGNQHWTEKQLREMQRREEGTLGVRPQFRPGRKVRADELKKVKARNEQLEVAIMRVREILCTYMTTDVELLANVISNALPPLEEHEQG